MSIIFEGKTKKVDMQAALTALATAYESNDAGKIADAKTNCKDTLAEKNRLARMDFYKSKMSDDITETRKNIIAAGYIPQHKLTDKVKDGVRTIGIDASETQVDIMEVNKMVRAEIFDEPIIYAVAKVFRDGACAYVASHLEKTGIEEALGFSASKYIGAGETSKNALTKALQRAFDEILFIDNGKGKNTILAKKSDVTAFTCWMTTKASHYGSKFANTETIIRYVTDALWAKLNGKELVLDCGDVKF